MAKYCIWFTRPTYGPRDEITGVRHHLVECHKSLRVARKRVKSLGADDEGGFEGHHSLCRGDQPCAGWAVKQVGSKRATRYEQKLRSGTYNTSKSDLPF